MSRRALRFDMPPGNVEAFSFCRSSAAASSISDGRKPWIFSGREYTAGVRKHSAKYVRESSTNPQRTSFIFLSKFRQEDVFSEGMADMALIQPEEPTLLLSLTVFLAFLWNFLPCLFLHHKIYDLHKRIQHLSAFSTKKLIAWPDNSHLAAYKDNYCSP